MVLFTPPATARCLNRQHQLARLFTGCVSALAARIEILVEIGNGRLIHGQEVGGAPGVLYRAIRIAPHDSALAFHALSQVQTMYKLREACFRVTAVNV